MVECPCSLDWTAVSTVYLALFVTLSEFVREERQRKQGYEHEGTYFQSKHNFTTNIHPLETVC